MDVSIDDVEPAIDKETLFSGRWQFRKGVEVGDWPEFRRVKVEPIYERILAQIKSNHILAPKISYGYFECRRSGNSLFVTGPRKTFRFDFPREKRVPHRCVADFFGLGFVAMQIVTVGGGVNQEASHLFKDGKFSDSFYLKGFAAEAAEALAKYGHKNIRKELSVEAECGERFSPGYPSFPNIIYQRDMVALLNAKDIGVSLTSTCMLIPEHTTSAFISIDSKAAHFNPNII
jgi:5-methyltetrahydrofolate--homocysteine methyltransferase